jgi:glycosyltransferase involved in cell wall biosynthesis
VISFSIIIPTYNRAEKITALVESIYTHLPIALFELIVVVDGSTDQTTELLKKIEKVNLVIIQQANGGRAQARNAGAKQAKGQFLLFLDDDTRISYNILTQHLDFQIRKPCLLNGQLKIEAYLANTDFVKYRAFLLNMQQNKSDATTQISAHNFSFTSGHLSMPKSFFDLLGGFHEKLTDAEDYDLAMRTLEQNIPIFNDPTISVFLDDFANCRTHIYRQIEYKKSHIRLQQLGLQYNTSIFKPLEKPNNRAKLFLLGMLAYRGWVWGIDHQLFLWLPKMLRYKFYSTVVYAHTLKGLSLL